MSWSWPLFFWFTIGGFIGFCIGVWLAQLAGYQYCKHPHCRVGRLDVAVFEIRKITHELRALKEGVKLH